MDKQLLDEDGNVVAEILDGDGEQQYIQIHPSKLFPFGVLLNYSLVDGKPYAEFDTSQGGPRANNGDPCLRIYVDDRGADEDWDIWPDLPDWEDPKAEPEIDVRYPYPRPKLLTAMWYLHDMGRVTGVHRHMIVEFVRDGVTEKLDVLGFGSKFGGWTESGEYVENVPVDQVIAATLVDRP